ncbi:hypothetical protein BYT27DRAFT_7249190 [Phlegmacium glaucopus]|nr:hypothetical protein BYT27DRAFT_7249190 [Phlegmacium glaucopus]
MSAFNKEPKPFTELSEVEPETKKGRDVVDMDTIELKEEDLNDMAKVDTETVFIDNVFKQHDQNGLIDDEAHVV